MNVMNQIWIRSKKDTRWRFIIYSTNSDGETIYYLVFGTGESDENETEENTNVLKCLGW